MTGASPGSGILQLIDRWVSDLHRHVRLVYPYADTDDIVRVVFSRLVNSHQPVSAPTARAWLYGLARAEVYAIADDTETFRRRNAEAVVFGLHDALDGLSAAARSEAELTVLGLSSLPADQQDLLRLCTVETLADAEVAWIMGIEEQAANERLAFVIHALSRASEGGRGTDGWGGRHA